MNHVSKLSSESCRDLAYNSLEIELPKAMVDLPKQQYLGMIHLCSTLYINGNDAGHSIYVTFNT